MLSISKCKKILEAGGKRYSDSEVKKLRDLLYTLATIEYNDFEEKKRNGTQSYNIYQSLN